MLGSHEGMTSTLKMKHNPGCADAGRRTLSRSRPSPQSQLQKTAIPLLGTSHFPALRHLCSAVEEPRVCAVLLRSG